MSYSYQGEDTYQINLTVYRDCGPSNSNGTYFDPQAFFGVWDGEVMSEVLVALLDESTIALIEPSTFQFSCGGVTDIACVEKASYSLLTTLLPSEYGYDIIWQRCCRNSSITNLVSFSGGDEQGMTISTHVPGTNDGVDTGINTTPASTQGVPINACVNLEFSWDFGGTDEDGDSLRYSLCSPKLGGDASNAMPQIPTSPPFMDVMYSEGFGPESPLTDPIELDPVTGVLSFTPTIPGTYVFGLCVTEIRNGIDINSSLKDFQVSVAFCSPFCDENGNCINDSDEDGVCDELEVAGCMDTLACNYNAALTDLVDCIYLGENECDCEGTLFDPCGICGGESISGCNDEEACNFNPEAFCDDGSCVFPPEGYCDCEGNIFDAIGECGGLCLVDEDDDGICDDVDDCFGALDSCGVCNGPGAIFECGCYMIPSGDCDCYGNELDAVGVCGGNCLEDIDQDGLCDCFEGGFTQPFQLEQYVTEVLLGEGVAASNITFTGSMSQLGYLSCGGDIGISEGMSLHTDNSLCNDFCSDCLGGSIEEQDLLTVANSVPPLIGQSFSVSAVYDVAVLEFDFYAAGDSIFFNYIFGSDEYLTYVNSQYNDVFGFFLSGPGINGPYNSPEGFPNGAINLAVVPGSDPELPITISSINNTTNEELYVDNPNQLGLCTNGYTTPLVAKAAVQCGEVYHMRLAIADGSDTALESFVILEAGSFTSDSPCLLGCTDEEAWNYDAQATTDNGTCLDCPPPSIFCGEGTVWDDITGTCIPAVISCGPGTVWSSDSQACVVQLPGDMDFDLCVSVPDLLELLVVWGTCIE